VRSLSVADRLSAWRYAFATTNPPAQGVVDPVTRWLVVTRAGVLPMTFTSGLIAVLLAAVATVSVDWLNVVLAVVGIVVAHLANNLMNDLTDTDLGNDTADYPRALYAPHPILAGLVTRRQLLAGILLCQVIDLAIMITLIVRQDWWVAAFALGGLFLSWAYTAPPLRLKKIGLGEVDVLVTWGPLMVGGVYYAGTGTLPWPVVVAAFVYALLPTTVLMGKHIDKLPYDARGDHDAALLRGRGGAGRRRRAALAGAGHAGRPTDAGLGVAAVPRAEARRPAAQQPGLATVVGTAGVHPHPPGRRPADHRTGRVGDLDGRSLRARAEQVPFVAGDVFEHDHAPVDLVPRLAVEDDTRFAHPVVRGREIVDPQEEADPAGQLVADYLGLVVAVGLGEQQAGLRAGRADHHPALRAAVVGRGRAVLDQVESEGVDEEADRLVVVVDHERGKFDVHGGKG